MSVGAYFSVSSLIIMMILALMFFTKKHVKNIETKIYGIILVVTILGLSLEVLTCIWFNKGVDLNSIFYQIASKLTSSYYAIWSGLFVIYIMNICNSKEILKKIFGIILFITIMVVLVLPISFDVSNKGVLPIGPSIYLTYGMCFLFTLIDVYYCIRYRNKIVSTKFTPVYSLLVLGSIDLVLSVLYPELFLMGYVYSLIVIIMYFTIENPDVKMIAQMEIARDHAEKANRAKSDFLSSMSHEIRTPLNAIVGLSEDIATFENQVPQQVVEDSKDIQNASQTLLEIVGNILDINKIESEKMEITNNPYNFREEIIKMCKITSTRIGEKNINFKLEIADDLPYELIGDKVHIKEIINNLLTNAIKYTEEGQIVLKVRCVNNFNKQISNVIISCQDTGRGIKAEYINKLFTKFERLDIEKNSTTEGTGLGLAITKALVDMMNGTINVNSQFGKGSLFMVTIPQKISKIQKPMTEKELEDTGTKLYSKSMTEKTSTQSNIAYGNKKILIVDDNNLNIKVAKRALSEFNFEIDECNDGQQCLDKINSGNLYDLILMDIMMPNMSGETALAKLKENASFKIPVIALTADAFAGAKEKYIGEGFVDYISKPFNKEQIKEKLDIVFNSKISNSNTEVLENNQMIEDKWRDAPTYVVGNNIETNLVDNEINSYHKDNKGNKEYLKSNNINVDHGLELLGDMEMYDETIGIFFDGLSERISKLQNYKNSSDIKNYAIEVHALKSDCKYIGALDLADMAYAHELKSKANEINYINENFQSLIKKIVEVAKVVKEYLGK